MCYICLQSIHTYKVGIDDEEETYVEFFSGAADNHCCSGILLFNRFCASWVTSIICVAAAVPCHEQRPANNFSCSETCCSSLVL